MRNFTVILLLCFAPVLAWGQSDVLLTQQIFSRMNMNPSATGASNYDHVFFLGRVQWVGVEGAPNTQYLDLHKSFAKYNSAFGLSFMRDRIGLENMFNVKLSYAYHLRLTSSSYLSMGLAGGILNRSVSGNRIYEDPTAQPLYYSEAKLYPDFDVGLEYGHNHLLLGASVTHLTNSPSPTSLEWGRQFYTYAQYDIPLDEKWQLTPSVIFTAMGNQRNLDGLLVASYGEFGWLGASVRLNEAFAANMVAVLAGVWVSKNLQIGYSYDIPISTVALRTGAHEIMLHWRLGKEPAKTTATDKFFDYSQFSRIRMQ